MRYNLSYFQAIGCGNTPKDKRQIELAKYLAEALNKASKNSAQNWIKSMVDLVVDQGIDQHFSQQPLVSWKVLPVYQHGLLRAMAGGVNNPNDEANCTAVRKISKWIEGDQEILMEDLRDFTLTANLLKAAQEYKE